MKSLGRGIARVCARRIEQFFNRHRTLDGRVTEETVLAVLLEKEVFPDFDHLVELQSSLLDLVQRVSQKHKLVEAGRNERHIGVTFEYDGICRINQHDSENRVAHLQQVVDLAVEICVRLRCRYLTRCGQRSGN